MSHTDDHSDLKALILENQRLLAENNLLLKKMRKVALWDFGIRLVITAVFLGLPFVAYFYVLEQYSETLGKFFHVIQDISKDQGLGGMLIRHNGQGGN